MEAFFGNADHQALTRARPVERQKGISAIIPGNCGLGGDPAGRVQQDDAGARERCAVSGNDSRKGQSAGDWPREWGW